MTEMCVDALDTDSRPDADETGTYDPDRKPRPEARGLQLDPPHPAGSGGADALPKDLDQQELRKRIADVFEAVA